MFSKFRMADGNPDLRLYCWEGYDSPIILDPFQKRYGIEIQARTLISDAEAAHKIANQSPAERVDILNINNAWVQKFLHPRGAVQTLDKQRLETGAGYSSSVFGALNRWGWSQDGAQRIGISQRFGPFNLVINDRRISEKMAQDEGFKLAADPDLFQRYGILLYEDFNIFHICIASGLDPFEPLSSADEAKFEKTARDWFKNAALITNDHHTLNHALVEGQIDFYLSGGIYTASPARLDGQTQVRAITPLRGPIKGCGGIVFTEVNCALARPELSPWTFPFLEYLLEPETAIQIAFLEGTCNPVVQMENPRVMSAFSRTQLDVIQWDTLEEDVSRCAHYDMIPNSAELLPKLRQLVAESRKAHA